MTEHKYDVLFLDDDPNILRAIRRNLRGKFEICISETVEDALSKVDEMEFPVIVSDMKMPGMNGADFLIKVKEKQPDAIRILLTGESGLEEAIKAINESDIYKFLTKPCPTEKLISTLDSALRLYRSAHIEELIMDKSVKGFVYIISDLMNIISPEIFKKSRDVSRIAKSSQTNFPINDKWSFEVASLVMYLGSIHYKIYAYDKFYGTKAMVEILNKSATLVFKIPKFEEVHNILFDLANFYKDKVVIDQLDCDSKVLKLIIDYYHMVSHKNFKPQFLSMYSKEVVLKIPEMLGKKAQAVEKSVSADQLKINMSAAENIVTISGSILVNKGEKITQENLDVLKLFSSKQVLIEPFKVRES